jgi:hypothetical protein
MLKAMKLYNKRSFFACLLIILILVTTVVAIVINKQAHSDACTDFDRMQGNCVPADTVPRWATPGTASVIVQLRVMIISSGYSTDRFS